MDPINLLIAAVSIFTIGTMITFVHCVFRAERKINFLHFIFNISQYFQKHKQILHAKGKKALIPKFWYIISWISLSVFVFAVMAV